MKKIFLSFILATTLINSCKNDDEGVCNFVLDQTSLEAQYGCTNTIYDLDVDWEAVNDQQILIRNQAKFDELVTGSCLPQIDFSKYDLILALMVVSDVESVSYSPIQLCNQNITLSVYIQDSGNSVNLGTFHVLIPKLNENQILEGVFHTQ